MKLLGSTESKITKDKNGENVSHLEFLELILVHCSLCTTMYTVVSLYYTTMDIVYFYTKQDIW